MSKVNNFTEWLAIVKPKDCNSTVLEDWFQSQGYTNETFKQTIEEVNEKAVQPVAVSKVLENLVPKTRDEDFQKILREAEKRNAKERQYIKETYGFEDNFSIRAALEYEKVSACCKECRGYPCSANTGGATCNLEIDAANHATCRYTPCKFRKEKIAQAQFDKRLNRLNLPSEYKGKTFSDYVVDANNCIAVEVAKSLIDDPRQSAYFYGSVGCGKTLLASIVAQEIIKDRQAYFTTVPNLSLKIRSTFKNNSTTDENEELQKLFTVPTLILDDIGMERATQFVCSTLSNIFNERYNRRLQTILTSNLPLKTLENRFNSPTDSNEKTLDGTRIYDRCKQILIPVELKGGSRRCG